MNAIQMRRFFFVLLLLLLSSSSLDSSVRGADDGIICNTTESMVAPPPFDEETTKPTVYVVMILSTGEFFDKLREGMALQALGIGDNGVTLEFLIAEDANYTDEAQMVEEAAQDPRTVGIVTVDGSADAMCNVIQSAIETMMIPIVSFDFDGDACTAGHVLTAQNDDIIASFVLDQALKDLKGATDVQVGYISDLNFQPLIVRNEVWETYKAQNNWNQVFFIDNAASFSSAEDLQMAIVQAIDDAGIDLDFIYAPWDHLAINTLAAVKLVNHSSMVNAIYGADFNDEDIQAMTAPDSIWKATAGGDPVAIGASLIRMIALLVGGELDDDEMLIPSTLITQDYLLENDITSMSILRTSSPNLALPYFMNACWISSIEYVKNPTSAPSAMPTTSATTPSPPASSTIAGATTTAILMVVSIAWSLVLF